MALFKMEEDPVNESPSSISTGDNGTIVGESGRDFSSGFSSTLIVPFVSDCLDRGEERKRLGVHDLHPKGRHDWGCWTVVVVVVPDADCPRSERIS